MPEYSDKVSLADRYLFIYKIKIVKALSILRVNYYRFKIVSPSSSFAP